MNKVCVKCGKEKSITDFYVHQGMLSGRLNYCKECVKERVRNHSHTEHSRRINKEWLKTEKGKAKLKRHTQRYRRLNPEKYKAHMVVNNALRCGKLIKQLCEVCGSKEVENHHNDYSKPLEVRWLCRKHHRLLPF